MSRECHDARRLFEAGWRAPLLGVCTRTSRREGSRACWRIDADALAEGEAAFGPCWRCLQWWASDQQGRDDIEAQPMVPRPRTAGGAA